MVPLRATYRIQFHPGFGFDEAAGIVEYLSGLGISHLYCSPYTQAAPGSTHGYDVVDHRAVNVELGGAAAHERMCAALRAHGLSQILDIVPNHMAIGGPQNPWWWDVLENGPSSNYAAYFDVDWDTPETRLRNVVLLPVLSKQYGRALESGEIRLDREGGNFVIRYYDHKFPVAPRSLDTLLNDASERCGCDELGFIADSLFRLPLATATDRVSLFRRHRDKAVIGRQLQRLVQERPDVARAIDVVIATINADRATLHAMLERQNYRLASWRAAGRDLGYRRFFDINTLVGIRMEDERVFADTHALVLQWLASGILDGLRIDHIDGLRDPEQYLRRLCGASPGAWLLVEKILQSDESLRASWPIGGTTGYDFLNRVGGLFIDPAGEEPLTRLYHEFTGEPTDFDQIARDKKDLVMREILGSDLSRLTALLVDVCEKHPSYRDYTRHELHEALMALAARLPVYRTYIRESDGKIDPADERYISEASVAAKQDRTTLEGDLFDFLRDILLLRVPGALETELAMRFQQFTGPVMAKALEDTAFYCFNRFVCLNEVGGDPERFGTTIEEFQRACESVAQRWPLTMLATSTHDTKRSEDMRARLSVLSEIPDEWAAAVRRWAQMNEPHWRGEQPDRNAEYLLYQSLVGAWPIEKERVTRYMQKTIREAKQHTSWTNPNRQYEELLLGFVDSALSDREFLVDVDAFVAPIVQPGQVNSLAQTLIKLTAPGIPDLYQGSELWHFALVDPDNRGPVDYDLRRRLLRELERISLEEIVSRAAEGLPKLWLIRQTLALRRRLADAFGPDAAFLPLEAHGERAGHVVAFRRGDTVITTVPRLGTKIRGQWHDTRLEIPSGNWRNELTAERVCGGTVEITSLFARFPVCLLSRETSA
jgi:(1->4)-alpha-D-glucan 1-alpha-D-glucosylmutase